MINFIYLISWDNIIRFQNLWVWELKGGNCDILIMDEIMGTLSNKLISGKQIIDIINY